MKKKYYILIIIISFIFNQSNNEPEYVSAYDFNLSLFNNSGKDSTIKLSSLKGNVILLNFWATWCGPCIAEIPEFNNLYNEYKDQGFEILGVSVSDVGERTITYNGNGTNGPGGSVSLMEINNNRYVTINGYLTVAGTNVPSDKK